MGSVPNPYSNQDLFVSKEFSESHMKHLVGRGDPRKPFSRQVDLWWVALCLGIRAEYRTRLGPREGLVKFNDGGILASDPWRITHLELLALAELGEGGLGDPAATIQMASEYAATGLKAIGEMCVGAPEPTLTVVTRIVEFGPGTSG